MWLSGRPAAHSFLCITHWQWAEDIYKAAVNLMRACFCKWRRRRQSVCPQVEPQVCSPFWPRQLCSVSTYSDCTEMMTSNDFQVLCVQSSYNQPITTAFTFLIFNTSTTSALLPSMMLLLLALTTFRRHFNADFLSIISWGIMCSVELQLSAAWIRNRVDVDIRSPRTKTISLLFITSALRYHFQIPKGRQKLQNPYEMQSKGYQNSRL